MGDVYVSGADYISGQATGMGKVYYSPGGASCQVQGGFFGGACARGDPPGPRWAGCARPDSDVDGDNSAGFVVDVRGGSCQSRSPGRVEALGLRLRDALLA